MNLVLHTYELNRKDFAMSNARNLGAVMLGVLHKQQIVLSHY